RCRMVDAELLFVAVDGLGFAIAVEIENRAAGAARRAILGGCGPKGDVQIRDGGIHQLDAVERRVLGPTGHQDVRYAVAIDVGHRGGPSAVIVATAHATAGLPPQEHMKVDAFSDESNASRRARIVAPDIHHAAVDADGYHFRSAVVVEIGD